MGITMEDIIASNRIKEETCNNCKECLKNVLTSEQLEKFEDVFYAATQDYIIRRQV